MDLINIPYISVGPRNRTIYVKDCFNESSKTKKQNKSRFRGIFCQNTTEIGLDLDHLVRTFRFCSPFFTLVVCIHEMIVNMYLILTTYFDINH